MQCYFIAQAIKAILFWIRGIVGIQGAMRTKLYKILSYDIQLKFQILKGSRKWIGGTVGVQGAM